FFPLLFRNRLVPGKTELLVMNSELHLELFQTLLLRAKVINIRKGKVVRSTETGVGLVSDDVLRELIQLLIAVAHDAPIENMVIIATTVKPDKELLGEFLNLVRLRVDHTNNLVLTVTLPVHNEQVGEDLNVIVNDLRNIEVRSVYGRIEFRINRILFSILRYELHVLHLLDRLESLVCALRCKGQNTRSKIRQIPRKTTIVVLLKNLVDEVNRWLRSWMDLLAKISFDKISKSLFGLNHCVTNHLFLLERNPAIDGRKRHVGTCRQRLSMT